MPHNEQSTPMMVAPNSDQQTRHITLIRPPVVSPIKSFYSPVALPLALAYLAASLRDQRFRVSVIDAVGEAVDQIQRHDALGALVRGLTIEEIVARIMPGTHLIAVSCMFSQEWLFIQKLLERIKAAYPHVPIVLGGEHASAMSTEILQMCPAVDLCVKGEGEEAIVNIARYFPHEPNKITGAAFRDPDGKIRDTSSRPRIRTIENIPWPAWDLFPLEVYLGRGDAVGPHRGRSIPLLASRGCPYQCTFCSSPSMWTQLYEIRSPLDVINEIETYIQKYQITHVEFVDLTAIVKKDWIMQFGRLMEERKINVSWSLPSGTRSEALDEEVIELMARTRCYYLVYAAESGSERVLKLIKKQIHLDKMVASMKAAKKHGLSIRCNLMIGFPPETRRDVFKTIRFQLRLALLGVDDVPLYIFSPYPGSALFKEMRQKGKIKSIDENYFRGLLSQDTLTRDRRNCEHIGPAELKFYSCLGVSLFYIIGYLVYPRRIMRSLSNVFFKKDTRTIFEQRIVENLKLSASRPLNPRPRLQDRQRSRLPVRAV